MSVSAGVLGDLQSLTNDIHLALSAEDVVAGGEEGVGTGDTICDSDLLSPSLLSALSPQHPFLCVALQHMLGVALVLTLDAESSIQASGPSILVLTSPLTAGDSPRSCGVTGLLDSALETLTPKIPPQHQVSPLSALAS